MNREERNKRNEAMKAYKAEGHSFDEVSEHFGVSRSLAQQVTKGIAPQTYRRPKSYRNQYTAPTEKAKAAKAERINKVVHDNAPDFEYVGGYTNGEGTVLLRCKKCGNIETRAWITVRHAHLGTKLRCDACEEEKRQAYKAEKKAAKEQQRAEVRRLRAEAAAKTRYERSIKQVTFSVCKECGGVFVPEHGNQVYCSEACARRKVNKQHKDKRLSRIIVVDRDIEIHELAKRCGDVCALCGKAVDWNDFEVRGQAFIAGDNYPSIDHIVPVAHEGRHEWGNVQIAHRRCNYLKGDSPPVTEAP